MTTKREVVWLGVFVAGSIPPPITVTFVDDTGDPVNLTGFDLEWHEQKDGEEAVVTSVALSGTPSDGALTYEFTEADFEEGLYEGEGWAGNGTNRYPSNEVYQWRVVAGVGDPPTI